MKYFLIAKNDEKILVNLSSNIFNVRYNEILLHQLIVYCLSNSHKNIKSHKSRGEVRGGGKKPWKQKGSGRARVGSIRSPIWRGGGKTFTFVKKKKIKFNKKMYKLGMRVIFSELLRNKNLFIIDNIILKNTKTRNFLSYISYLNIDKFSLIVSNDHNVHVAARNLKDLKTIYFEELNPIILLKFNYIYLTKDVVLNIQRELK